MKPELQSASFTAEHLPEVVQDRLARVLDDYLVAAEAGTPISPDELLQRHPEDAAYLRTYLSGLQIFHAAAVAPELPRGGSNSGSTMDPPPTVGDFQLLREIGRGGMGVVYEALQSSLRRRVAVKVLPFTARQDEKQIIRFRNEAQAAAHVEHPNIVPVYAVGEDHGVNYYAMQLIDGQSLSTMLAELHTRAAHTTEANRRRTTWGKKTGEKTIAALGIRGVRRAFAMSASSTNNHVRAVARLGIQAAEALHAAHEYGIVHRDVKPSNLLVDDQGKLWVTDFGVARCREDAGLTQTGDIVGTMRYMSPEQALGRSGLIDHRTDIYSLGVTLYELATLHHPSGPLSDAALLIGHERFHHKRLRYWNRCVPRDFETIVMKAIAEFPHERYATAQQFADDLKRYLDGKPICACRPSLVNRAGKWARRHRGVVYTAAAVLLLALAGHSYNTVLLARKNAETERALITARNKMHEAHAVLDRFGSRLVDQLAAIPGAEGVRYQLLEDSLGLYERFVTQASAEPALATDLALAYSKMGGLSEKMGKSEVALQNHLASRDLWEARVADEPRNAEYTRNLALCHNNVGLLLAELGRQDEGLRSLYKARRLQQQLLTADPDSPAILTDLATTHGNLGLVLKETGERAVAAEKFREAIAMQKRLVKQSPKDESVLRGLAASYNNLGALVGPSHEEDAINIYQKAIAIQRRLVDNQPINRLYQGDLARTYNNLGYALARRQDWQNAERCYLNAATIQENLVKASPMAASYRRDLAISCNNLGMVQSRDDRFAKAESSFRRALKLQELLLAAEPADAKTLSNVGGVYNNLALLFDRQKRFTEAESTYQHAVRFQRQAFEASPGASQYGDLLRNHYANYANCLRTQKKLQAADELSREFTTLLAEHQ